MLQKRDARMKIRQGTVPAPRAGGGLELLVSSRPEVVGGPRNVSEKLTQSKPSELDSACFLTGFPSDSLIRWCLRSLTQTATGYNRITNGERVSGVGVKAEAKTSF